MKSQNKSTKINFIEELFKRFAKANPDPRCELTYNTPFQLLVSVVLSAQTTDKSVNRCMEPLYEKEFIPSTVLAMGVAKFQEKIRTVGLAPTKAKNVVKLSEIIHKTYKDQVPNNREQLEELPGVGRKTANVILGEIFREPTLAVDTHVFRITQRLGLQNEKNPQKAEPKLLELIPAKYLPQAHHWFILHGRYTCKAQKPLCETCIVHDLCPSYKKFQRSK